MKLRLKGFHFIPHPSAFILSKDDAQRGRDDAELCGRVAAHVAVGLYAEGIICFEDLDADARAEGEFDFRVREVAASVYAREFAQEPRAREAADLEHV